MFYVFYVIDLLYVNSRVLMEIHRCTIRLHRNTIVQRHPSSSHRRHNHFSKKKKKLWVTKRFFFYNIGKNSVKYERMIYVYDRHIRYAS